MDIQRLNANIKWQQLTAQEILKYQEEGEDVPKEYQKWAAAISAVLEVSDEVTYEMTNGETDIAVLEETLGRELLRTDIQPADQSENNIGNESEEVLEEFEPELTLTNETPAGETTTLPEEPEDITLADQALMTDFNEIIKRRQRRGIPPLS